MTISLSTITIVWNVSIQQEFSGVVLFIQNLQIRVTLFFLLKHDTFTHSLWWNMVKLHWSLVQLSELLTWCYWMNFCELVHAGEVLVWVSGEMLVHVGEVVVHVDREVILICFPACEFYKMKQVPLQMSH